MFNLTIVAYVNLHFMNWYDSSIEENTWGASLYLLGHSIVENVPLAALLLSLNFAVNEKIRAIILVESSSESPES